MGIREYPSLDEAWADYQRTISTMLKVRIRGFEHLIERADPNEPDVFYWVAGQEIVDFFSRHDVPMRSMRDSDDHDVTTFLFSSTRPDVAALFKLTFA